MNKIQWDNLSMLQLVSAIANENPIVLPFGATRFESVNFWLH